ncbi:MAG: DUF2752 domain-containing protein [Verrucomicrobiales bacterium]|nr:DUF2752 domain-containing protein [Verrucomicrobiales bacterium]
MSWRGIAGNLREVVTFPLVAWLIRERKVAAAMLVVCGVLGGLQQAGIRIWLCPFRAVTGLDCPGCGLTRGACELMRGDIAGSIGYHWFTPVFVVGAVTLGVGVALPATGRSRYADWCEWFERRSGVSGGVLMVSVIYGLTRNFWQ